jgi:hypothetical protein
VVMAGCVSIAGDRFTTWWLLGTSWQVVNMLANWTYFINIYNSRKLLGCAHFWRQM